jgi:hypothetical protein
MEEILSGDLSNYVFVGKSNSGKSKTVKYLSKILFEKEMISYIIVFATSATKKKQYNWLNEKYVITEYSDDKIKEIMDYQVLLNDNSETPIYALIIFDDIAYYKDAFKKKTLEKLFTEAKNHFIKTMTVLHYSKMLHSNLILGNINKVFIYAIDDPEHMKSAHQHFGILKSYNDFKDMVIKNTGNYNILLYDKDNNEKPYRKIKHKLPNDFYLEY